MADKVIVTDYDMNILSQLAYLHGAVSNETIGKLVNEYRYSINNSDESNLLRKMYRNSEKTGTLDNRKYLDNKTLLTKTDLSKYDDWIITNMAGTDYPDNSKSGLYAYTVKAGGNNIVVFRGSENPVKNINDWQSDVDLINSSQTPQQKDAGEYILLLAKNAEISSSFYITGHSLGGNLAMYAAITAPDSIKKRLQKCDSFNGPGFDLRFIIQNSSNIEKVKNRIFAFQNENDFISSILNCPVRPIIIKSALSNRLDAYNHAASVYMLDGTNFVHANSKFFADNGIHDLSIALQFDDSKVLNKIKLQILAFMQNDSKLTLNQKIALTEFFLPVFLINPVADIKIAGTLTGGLGGLLLLEYVKQTVISCIKNLPGDFNNFCNYFKIENADNVLASVPEKIINSVMQRIGN